MERKSKIYFLCGQCKNTCLSPNPAKFDENASKVPFRTTRGPLYLSSTKPAEHIYTNVRADRTQLLQLLMVQIRCSTNWVQIEFAALQRCPYIARELEMEMVQNYVSMFVLPVWSPREAGFCDSQNVRIHTKKTCLNMLRSRKMWLNGGKLLGLVFPAATMIPQKEWKLQWHSHQHRGTRAYSLRTSSWKKI